MPSYPYKETIPVALPYNMPVEAFEAYNEPERIYHTVQEALLDLEANFEDDAIVRIICAAACLLQKDWSLEDALSTAVIWERG